MNPSKWPLILINCIMKYSISLWKYQNSVIYRSTKEDTWTKDLEELRSIIVVAYTEFISDPFIISWNTVSLFHYPFLATLALDYDSQKGWITTSTKAKAAQEAQWTKEAIASKTIFWPKPWWTRFSDMTNYVTNSIPKFYHSNSRTNLKTNKSNNSRDPLNSYIQIIS